MISEIALVKSKTQGSASLLVEPALVPDLIVDTAKRVDEMPLSELEAKLPEYIQRNNQNAFVLGGVLERIRRERFWNPGSRQPQNALFERWVEDTCHYSGRKARYLISVYVGLVQAAIPWSSIADIGWSKLRMIAPLLQPLRGGDAEIRKKKSHNDELVRLARGKSRKALEASLKSASTGRTLASTAAETKSKARRYSFKVRDGADVVDAALEMIAKQTGHTGGAALVDMANAIRNGGTLPPRRNAHDARHANH